MKRSDSELDVQIRSYRRCDDGTPLELVIRRTTRSGLSPCVLDFHGGAWSHFGPGIDFALCEGLALRGYVTIAVGFRLAPAHRWPTILSDARAALAWVLAHADELAIDRTRIGAIGGSSGGHIATMLGLTPHDADPQCASVAMPGLAFVTALYPILDVPARRAMVESARFGAITEAIAHAIDARRAHADGPRAPRDPSARLRAMARLRREHPALGDGFATALQIAMDRLGRVALVRALAYPHLVRAHDATFEDERAQADASPRHVVAERRMTHAPPMLVIQGPHDPNLTASMSESFAVAYRRAGGAIELHVREGCAHGFASIPSPMLDRVVAEIDAFAQRVTSGRPRTNVAIA